MSQIKRPVTTDEGCLVSADRNVSISVAHADDWSETSVEVHNEVGACINLAPKLVAALRDARAFLTPSTQTDAGRQCAGDLCVEIDALLKEWEGAVRP